VNGSPDPPEPEGEARSATADPVWKRRVSAGLVVLSAVALFVAVVTNWSERTLFDSDEFAARAVLVLDSAAVRHAMAEQITDELVENGPSTLASFRSLLVGAVEDVIATDGFKAIFRGAVEAAHHVVFERHASHAVLSLGETLALLTSSTEDANPSLASQLPKDASRLLIDISPVVRRLHPWVVAERISWLEGAAWTVTIGAAAGAIALARRRRRVVEHLGLAIILTGAAVVAFTQLIPRLVVPRISQADLIAPVSRAVALFLGDLSAAGLWLIPAGVVVAAAAASSSPRVGVDARRGWQHLARWTSGAGGTVRQVTSGGALVVGGLIAIWARTVLVSLAVGLVGAYVAYVGLTAFFNALLGPARVGDAATSDRTHRGLEPRLAIVSFAVLVLLALIGFGVNIQISTAAATARRASVMTCNGSAALCDRRLDQVTFPASHNSMSAADDPGWVFAENLHGIPAQLQYGIRALLVKTHYGIPTGIDEGNGAQLVVTDRNAELAVGTPEQDAELSPGELARAQQIERATPRGQNTHDVYLCHVYCSLGATNFVQTLDQIRNFLARNPDNVLMLFIGDYVSAADNAKAFARAGLTDRVWDYQTHEAPPTLRQMIDARRNILVLTEHSQPPPAWYTKGYGIFQDTPFTFATPAQLAAPASCRPNRGPADAPLFELNHFITNTSPPSVATARVVNARDFLLDRVSECEAIRHKTPTIVAVDFYDQGDLLGVVDELNGVSR
jgi:hypothetical protein